MQDQIQIEMTDRLSGRFTDIGGQIERPATSAIPLRPALRDGKNPLVVDPSERVEVTAVDMPGENLQPAHAISSMGTTSDCWFRAAQQASKTNLMGSAASAAAPSRNGPPGMVASIAVCSVRSRGAHRSGRVGPNRTTLGVRVAAATCEAPVSLVTRRSRQAMTA